MYIMRVCVCVCVYVREEKGKRISEIEMIKYVTFDNAEKQTINVQSIGLLLSR